MPIGDVLRGFHFEGSAFDADSFRLNWFFMPVFIPTDVLHFSLGGRIRRKSGSDGWNRNIPNHGVELNEAVQTGPLPILLRVESVQGAIEVLQERLDGSGGKAGSTREALAYCLAFKGRYDPATEHLKQIAASLDRSITWQRKKAERAELLMAKIAQGPEAVQAQLSEWRSQTVHNLGLSELLASTAAGAS